MMVTQRGWRWRPIISNEMPAKASAHTTTNSAMPPASASVMRQNGV